MGKKSLKKIADFLNHMFLSPFQRFKRLVVAKSQIVPSIKSKSEKKA